MKHLISIITLLCFLSCSKDDETSSKMKNTLISHQWELKDTIFSIGGYSVIYDLQVLEFTDKSFKLSQKRIVENSSTIEKDSLVIEGSYILKYPSISLESDERKMSGRFTENKIVLTTKDNPAWELFFYRK